MSTALNFKRFAFQTPHSRILYLSSPFPQEQPSRQHLTGGKALDIPDNMAERRSRVHSHGHSRDFVLQVDRLVLRPFFQPTLMSCINNDLLRVICKLELKVSATEVTDEQLGSYLNDFLKGCSTDLGWSLEKHFEEIKYDRSIVNPRSRIIDFYELSRGVSWW